MAREVQHWLAAVLFIPLLLGRDRSPPLAAPIRPVSAMRIQDARVLNDRWLPGRVRATQEVNLAFRVSGPLINLPFNVGDQVHEGDVVARIDPRDFQVAYQGAEANLAASRAQLQAMQVGARPEEIQQLQAAVQQAEARLQTATSELARAERLVESGTISRAEHEQTVESKIRAEAELRSAREGLLIGESGARPEDIEAKQAAIRSLEAAASSARDQLADTDLRAPFSGIVVARHVQNFEQVRAQQSILRILDTSQIEMVVNVPEHAISLVPYVTEVECVFDAFPDLQISAQLSEIGAEASRTTRTYPVTLIMDQPSGVRILPGMAGRARGQVQLPDDLGQGYEIPESAIFEREGQSYVWVLDSSDGESGNAITRHVTLGELSTHGLRVVEGLQQGELIATAGVNFLNEGQTVRLLDNSR